METTSDIMKKPRDSMVTKDRVFFINLGCPKNLVDTEHMIGLLRLEGFDLVHSIDEAGIVVINTCAFIHEAVRETIDTILECADFKKQGKLKKLVVVGCFVQRYGYKLMNEIPEVDGWSGTAQIHRITDLVDNNKRPGSVPFYITRPTYTADHSVPRTQTTPFYSAYLMVADGCSNRCSYCMIPRLRGPLRSRSMESVIMEAEEMAGRGVREINLIAQDTTMYGKDLDQDVCLEDLLEGLVKVNGIRWIRLLYCHPERVSDRLLDLIDSEEAICPYLDLPLQHVNNQILTAMERSSCHGSPWELIERIRSRKRRIAIRTTLMVGFPGETQKMFMELCDFVKMIEFDYLGVFAYSQEKGTPAARLRQSVESKIAQQRLKKIMSIQANISKKVHRRMVDHIVPVLIEGVSPETDLLLKGRTATMAPDVDGSVLINKGEGMAGEIMPVLIKEAHTYDVVGEII